MTTYNFRLRQTEDIGDIDVTPTTAWVHNSTGATPYAEVYLPKTIVTGFETKDLLGIRDVTSGYINAFTNPDVMAICVVKEVENTYEAIVAALPPARQGIVGMYVRELGNITTGLFTQNVGGDQWEWVKFDANHDSLHSAGQSTERIYSTDLSTDCSSNNIVHTTYPIHEGEDGCVPDSVEWSQGVFWVVNEQEEGNSGIVHQHDVMGGIGDGEVYRNVTNSEEFFGKTSMIVLEHEQHSPLSISDAEEYLGAIDGEIPADRTTVVVMLVNGPGMRYEMYRISDSNTIEKITLWRGFYVYIPYLICTPHPVNTATHALYDIHHTGDCVPFGTVYQESTFWTLSTAETGESILIHTLYTGSSYSLVNKTILMIDDIPTRNRVIVIDYTGDDGMFTISDTQDYLDAIPGELPSDKNDLLIITRRADLMSFQYFIYREENDLLRQLSEISSNVPNPDTVTCYNTGLWSHTLHSITELGDCVPQDENFSVHKQYYQDASYTHVFHTFSAALVESTIQVSDFITPHHLELNYGSNQYPTPSEIEYYLESINHLLPDYPLSTKAVLSIRTTNPNNSVIWYTYLGGTVQLITVTTATTTLAAIYDIIPKCNNHAQTHHLYNVVRVGDCIPGDTVFTDSTFITMDTDSGEGSRIVHTVKNSATSTFVNENRSGTTVFYNRSRVIVIDYSGIDGGMNSVDTLAYLDTIEGELPTDKDDLLIVIRNNTNQISTWMTYTSPTTLGSIHPTSYVVPDPSNLHCPDFTQYSHFVHTLRVYENCVEQEGPDLTGDHYFIDGTYMDIIHQRIPGGIRNMKIPKEYHTGNNILIMTYTGTDNPDPLDIESYLLSDGTQVPGTPGNNQAIFMVLFPNREVDPFWYHYKEGVGVTPIGVQPMAVLMPDSFLCADDSVLVCVEPCNGTMGKFVMYDPVLDMPEESHEKRMMHFIGYMVDIIKEGLSNTWVTGYEDGEYYVRQDHYHGRREDGNITGLNCPYMFYIKGTTQSIVVRIYVEFVHYKSNKRSVAYKDKTPFNDPCSGAMPYYWIEGEIEYREEYPPKKGGCIPLIGCPDTPLPQHAPTGHPYWRFRLVGAT